MARCLEFVPQPLVQSSKDGDGSFGPKYSRLERIPSARNPFRKILIQRCIIENDANMAGYGEYKLGAGKGHKNMLYFTISTGLGGGIIIEGELLQGEIGIATEVGHIVVHDKGATMRLR